MDKVCRITDRCFGRGPCERVLWPATHATSPDPDWAAANPQRSAKTATEMANLDIVDVWRSVGGEEEKEVGIA